MAEIDDLILPIIKILNQKGYITKYCCSGHTYESIPNTYIAFDKTTIPSTLPKCFVLEDEQYNKEQGWKWYNDTQIISIRKWYKNITKDKIHYELLKTHMDLLEWVERLENCENCNKS